MQLLNIVKKASLVNMEFTMLIAYLDLERKIVEQFARDYPAHSVRKLIIMSGEFNKYWKKKEAEILHGKTIACTEFDAEIMKIDIEQKKSKEAQLKRWEELRAMARSEYMVNKSKE